MRNKPTPLAALAGYTTIGCALAALLLAVTTTAGAARAAAAQAKPPVKPAITGVDLQPAKTLLEQPCPVVLVFHGQITTTRPVSVTYTWVDSHGRTWPEHHRRFSLAGVNGVSHKWKLGRRGKTVDEWVQLKVISPESRVSTRVPVHFTCAK